VRLGFDAGFVDEDAGVGVEAREGEGDVVVDEADFGGRDACVLEFHGGALFAAEDDDRFAFDSYGAGSYCVLEDGEKGGGCTSLDGLESVFDLEDVSIGTED
jgi:hypothetical protein